MSQIITTWTGPGDGSFQRRMLGIGRTRSRGVFGMPPTSKVLVAVLCVVVGAWLVKISNDEKQRAEEHRLGA